MYACIWYVFIYLVCVCDVYLCGTYTCMYFGVFMCVVCMDACIWYVCKYVFGYARFCGMWDLLVVACGT